MILLGIKLLVHLFTAFTMIVTLPMVYKRFNDFMENTYYDLDKITEKGKHKIRNYSISVIKNLYERNNKPSKKKILIISIVLNLMYAITMYNNFKVPSFISDKMFFLGLLFFLIIGTLIITLFEYFAYRINIKALIEYQKTNNKKFIVKALVKLFLLMYIVPSFVALLFMVIDSTFLGFIGTIVVYFSPVGVLAFIFNIFENTIGNDKYLLLLPMISIFSPIIFFLIMEYFYSSIKRIILPSIEVMEKLARYLQGKDSNQNMGIIFICFLVLLIILPILEMIL